MNQGKAAAWESKQEKLSNLKTDREVKRTSWNRGEGTINQNMKVEKQ